MIYNQPNMLMVAGTGRNVGKTSLVCSVIHRLANNEKIIAIKISPHFHKISSEEKILANNDSFTIIEELNANTTKDSSRMLKAGAERVFYVQAKDEVLNEVFLELRKFLPQNHPIVCESGGLRYIVNPGLFVVCQKDDKSQMKEYLRKLSPLVDKFVTLKPGFDEEASQEINFKQGHWSLNI